MTIMDKELEILEKAFGAMPDGYCVIHVIRDENEEPVDWKFSYVNEMMVEIEGGPQGIAAGKEAAELFEQSTPRSFDAILSDIQMPVMNGYEMAAAIRAGCHPPQAKEIPILAMTANAFSDDVKASQDAGMDGHVSKPIDFEVLADMLYRIFRDKR